MRLIFRTGGIAAAAILASQAAVAQLTTNAWQPTGAAAGGHWTNAASWLPGVPNASSDVAMFATDYTATFAVTQAVSITLNGLIYNDSGAGDTSILAIRPIGAATLTFAGATPFISNSSDYSAQLQIYTPVNIGTDGLTIRTAGNTSLRAFFGDGTLTASGGTVELGGDNTNFTGQIVINTGTTLDLRSGTANTLGTTNAGTVINGSGVLRLRDLNSIWVSEPVTINGFNNAGSIRGYASTNVTFDGPVLLNTNGVLAVQQWFSPAEPGSRRDWFLNGTIADDGNARGVHFLNGVGDSAGTGSLSRTSEILLGGASTYGGYTHITANRSPDGIGPFTATVRLTNGNDRLPVATTLYLGGLTNGVGISNGNGRFILNGYNQTLAGLATLGSGISNRVAGGSATLSTLTLDVGAGTNNLFGGTIGGAGSDDNNLAFISRGAGVLNLTGSNTYTGTTTVTNGALRVNGTHLGGGAYTIQNAGILGGTGLVDAAIFFQDGATVAPGNSPGTLALDGNLTFASNAILAFELSGTDTTPGAGINDLIAGADDLYLDGFLDLTALSSFAAVTTNDYWTLFTYDGLLLTNLLDVSLASQGLLSGGLQFAIDDSFSGEIRLTVIPEPSAIALLACGLTVTAWLAAARSKGRKKRP